MENIISIDSNNSITYKNGKDKVHDNDVVSEYKDEDEDEDKDEDEDEDDDCDDELSEFIAYRYHEFESDDDELDSLLDFKFDFDIIFSPENNSQLDHLTEIKTKIINKIKLSKSDLSYIQKINEDDKFELIKIFNHMV